MSELVTLSMLARMIDHALLHPTMTDAEIHVGLRLAREYGVATACVKPYSIAMAREVLEGSEVRICPVIGFPHGNSSTAMKVLEAAMAVRDGGNEIDMVINIGKVLGGSWDYVAEEIREINDVVTSGRAILKVIFENDYLQDNHIIKLCEICSDLKVAFVKTSTGYGFVKQDNGMFSYKGATMHHLKLMKQHCAPWIRVKAAGGVRTLDEMLAVRQLGVERIGTSATKALLEEARKRGYGAVPKLVEIHANDSAAVSGGY